MSASAARQTANTANAQLSTGPRTPEGKASSSQNARKHGLTAQDLLIGPEDHEEFNAMLADYQSDVAPQGAIQQTLFDDLVSAAWNLRRIRRMETELCAGQVTYLDLLNDYDLQTKPPGPSQVAYRTHLPPLPQGAQGASNHPGHRRAPARRHPRIRASFGLDHRNCKTNPSRQVRVAVQDPPGCLRPGMGRPRRRGPSHYGHLGYP
jgi:hypothetical protein